MEYDVFDMVIENVKIVTTAKKDIELIKTMERKNEEIRQVTEQNAEEIKRIRKKIENLEKEENNEKTHQKTGNIKTEDYTFDMVKIVRKNVLKSEKIMRKDELIREKNKEIRQIHKLIKELDKKKKKGI